MKFILRNISQRWNSLIIHMKELCGSSVSWMDFQSRKSLEKQFILLYGNIAISDHSILRLKTVLEEYEKNCFQEDVCVCIYIKKKFHYTEWTETSSTILKLNYFPSRLFGLIILRIIINFLDLLFYHGDNRKRNKKEKKLYELMSN